MVYREDLRKPLEEEKKTLQNSLYANRPETEEKFQKLKEIEVETQTIVSEIDKRYEVLKHMNKIFFAPYFLLGCYGIFGGHCPLIEVVEFRFASYHCDVL